MNLEQILKEVVTVVKQTGTFIQKERDSFSENQVREKSLNQLVSHVDEQAERMLVEKFEALIPEAGFITEEETLVKAGKGRYRWVIDPLDGTTNFIHSLPVYCVSVALMEKEEVVLGVIYEMNRDELFTAIKGKGAFLNGKPISTSKAEKLENTLLATGFPYYDFEKMNAYLELLHKLMRNTRGMRRMGSAAVDLAYVACGRFDGFFEYSLHPWDVAAGALIVQEAGGVVQDFHGKQDYLFGKEIIAGNPFIIKPLQEMIFHYFYENKLPPIVTL
jgi:myo-inositol-1(or 4)-monophosphatase